MLQPLRTQGGAGLLLVLLAGGAPAVRESRSVERVEVVPAELAILMIEDRVQSSGAKPAALREALAAAAVDAGFSPLSRPFIDQAEIDLDVPELGEAGVLRVRLLEWESEAGPPARVRGWVHMSLYQQGELLADYQFTVDRSTDHWIATVGPDGDQAALRRALAAEWIAMLPPPPDLNGR